MIVYQTDDELRSIDIDNSKTIIFYNHSRCARRVGVFKGG